jgi:hypothetical protein
MCSSGVQIVVIEPNTPAAMSQSIMRGDVIKFVDYKVTRSSILCLSLSLSPFFSVSRNLIQKRCLDFSDIVCTKWKAKRFSGRAVETEQILRAYRVRRRLDASQGVYLVHSP